MRVFLLLAFLCVASAMPFMLSDDTDIELIVAGNHITRLFDQLLVNDPSRARTVLDFGITSSIYPHAHRRSVRRYHDNRRDHVNKCRDAPDMIIQGGLRGFYILQSLLADHLNLLMSIPRENQLVHALMYAIYLKDTDTFAEFPSDDQLPDLLRQHAHDRHYTMWMEFLRWSDDEEDEDE